MTYIKNKQNYIFIVFTGISYLQHIMLFLRMGNYLSYGSSSQDFSDEESQSKSRKFEQLYRSPFSEKLCSPSWIWSLRMSPKSCLRGIMGVYLHRYLTLSQFEESVGKISTYFTGEKERDLAYAVSLPQVDISGDDSLRIFLSCDSSAKIELVYVSALPFLAEMGELHSRRMFPSDNDLLKRDLNTHTNTHTQN